VDPFGFGGIGDPMENVLSLQTFGFVGVSAENTGTCCTGSCPGPNTGTCSPDPDPSPVPQCGMGVS